MTKKINITNIVIYFILFIYSIYVLYPIVIMFMTSFKSNLEIMKEPLALPSKLYLQGYYNAWIEGSFGRYFANSVIVTTTHC